MSTRPTTRQLSLHTLAARSELLGAEIDDLLTEVTCAHLDGYDGTQLIMARDYLDALTDVLMTAARTDA